VNKINRLSTEQIKIFEAIIRNCGYAVNDFELSEVSKRVADGKINITRSVIAVNRKKTSIQRHYDDHHETKWLRDFERDLRGNVFGFVE
jgi:hypothetical protein